MDVSGVAASQIPRKGLPSTQASSLYRTLARGEISTLPWSLHHLNKAQTSPRAFSLFLQNSTCQRNILEYNTYIAQRITGILTHALYPHNVLISLQLWLGWLCIFVSQELLKPLSKERILCLEKEGQRRPSLLLATCLLKVRRVVVYPDVVPGVGFGIHYCSQISVCSAKLGKLDSPLDCLTLPGSNPSHILTIFHRST